MYRPVFYQLDCKKRTSALSLLKRHLNLQNSLCMFSEMGEGVNAFFISCMCDTEKVRGRTSRILFGFQEKKKSRQQLCRMQQL